MPTEQTGFSPAEWGSAIVLALGSLAVGVRKLLRMSAADKAATARSDGETDVVELLRSEVERLGKQNAALAEFANRLQLELLQLQQTNGRMQRQIDELQAQLQHQG
jgi:hypothetical protein